MGEALVRLRACLVAVASAGTWPLMLWLVLPGLHPSAATLEAVLAAGLSWALLACWLWLTMAVGLVALELALTGTLGASRRLAPRAVRFLAVLACGAGAVATLSGPAYADPVNDVGLQLRTLDGLALPDRVEGKPHAPQGKGPAPRRITVNAGDTLWELAERLETDWPRLYAANRAAIGPDPNLIHPGTRLVVPSHTHTQGDRP